MEEHSVFVFLKIQRNNVKTNARPLPGPEACSLKYSSTSSCGKAKVSPKQRERENIQATRCVENNQSTLYNIIYIYILCGVCKHACVCVCVPSGATLLHRTICPCCDCPWPWGATCPWYDGIKKEEGGGKLQRARLEMNVKNGLHCLWKRKALNNIHG